MTDWEAGQELIKASDCLVEVRKELIKTHPDLAKIFVKMINEISDVFDQLESHSFGITRISEPE